MAPYVKTHITVSEKPVRVSPLLHHGVLRQVYLNVASAGWLADRSLASGSDKKAWCGGAERRREQSRVQRARGRCPGRCCSSAF
uniref:Uncharacterized protein n=1 Tax=Knipowitschia caucasica TaxID=637954 RepID=A0AAV2L7G0_KNICA